MKTTFSHLAIAALAASTLAASTLAASALAAQAPDAPVVKEKPMPAATKPAEKPAQPAAAAPAVSGPELKLCLAVESREPKEASASFKVAAGTKIWAWTKVAGVAPGDYAIVFRKGDTEVFRQKLAVPSVPWRTQAYKTFRAGDGGAWTAALVGPDDKDAASAPFTVEIAP